MGCSKNDAVLWKCGWITTSGLIFQTAIDSSVNAGTLCDTVTPAV